MLMGLLLSSYSKIANRSTLRNENIDIPNPVLNVGVFNEYMGVFGQDKKPVINNSNIRQYYNVDTSYNAVTGKGAIYIPEQRAYFIGDAI
jgi:hypothetical protein